MTRIWTGCSTGRSANMRASRESGLEQRVMANLGQCAGSTATLVDMGCSAGVRGGDDCSVALDCNGAKAHRVTRRGERARGTSGDKGSDKSAAPGSSSGEESQAGSEKSCRTADRCGRTKAADVPLAERRHPGSSGVAVRTEQPCAGAASGQRRPRISGSSSSQSGLTGSSESIGDTMRKVFLIAAVLTLTATVAFTQDSAKEPADTHKAEKSSQAGPLGAYKLDFVLRELQDGKIVNTRNYMMILENAPNSWSEVKIGSRVPVTTGSNPSAWQYLDVGTNVNCRIWAGIQRPLVSLNCTVETSSFSLPEQKSTTGASGAPVINQIKSNIQAVVTEGKQRVISTIDDPSSTRRYEIALTATKVE